MSLNPWGHHLLLDCASGEIAKITSRENIAEFIKALVIAIDMKAYGEPMIERFATHDESKAGYSFCQMIETSNITGHFVEANGDFYLDIFSCKNFDVNTAIKIVYDFFKPTKVARTFIGRSA